MNINDVFTIVVTVMAVRIIADTVTLARHNGRTAR